MNEELLNNYEITIEEFFRDPFTIFDVLDIDIESYKNLNSLYMVMHEIINSITMYDNNMKLFDFHEFITVNDENELSIYDGIIDVHNNHRLDIIEIIDECFYNIFYDHNNNINIENTEMIFDIILDESETIENINNKGISITLPKEVNKIKNIFIDIINMYLVRIKKSIVLITSTDENTEDTNEENKIIEDTETNNDDLYVPDDLDIFSGNNLEIDVKSKEKLIERLSKYSKYLHKCRFNNPVKSKMCSYIKNIMIYIINNYDLIVNDILSEKLKNKFTLIDNQHSLCTYIDYHMKNITIKILNNNFNCKSDLLEIMNLFLLYNNGNKTSNIVFDDISNLTSGVLNGRKDADIVNNIMNLSYRLCTGDSNKKRVRKIKNPIHKKYDIKNPFYNKRILNILGQEIFSTKVDEVFVLFKLYLNTEVLNTNYIDIGRKALVFMKLFITNNELIKYIDTILIHSK